MTAGDPPGNDPSTTKSGLPELTSRVTCDAIETSLCRNVSWPATVPPSAFQRVLNASHTTFVYSNARSHRKYAERQPFVLYAYSALIALSVGAPV